VADGAAELRRAVAEGHELGNHSWSHPNLTDRPQLATREMRRTNVVIEEVTGALPRWFRPPFGRGADSLVAPAGEMGLEIALWDVDARDWGERDPEAIVERVLQGAEAGSVVVMHDQADDSAGATLAAIREIAPVLKDEGLEMVTLARLLSET
jgi:peptidoglycan/xylan/chitin deacetylase (PgdA/CDA1 family)